MVSHVSSSVPKMQLPTYLSIDDMIRTRSFQQNSGEALRWKIITIPNFAEPNWFAAITLKYNKKKLRQNLIAVTSLTPAVQRSPADQLVRGSNPGMDPRWIRSAEGHEKRACVNLPIG